MGILDKTIDRVLGRYLSRKGVIPASVMAELMRFGDPNYTSNNYEAMATQGWRKNELIFACINKTAMTASQVGMKVYDLKGDPDPSHPLQQILQKPNPFMSEFQFWYSVITFLKLAGVAYYEKVPAAGGSTAQLWPMRPDWVETVKSGTSYISGYIYKVPGRNPVNFEASQILRFSLFDPLTMFYKGWAPVNVAARVGDVDNAATDFLKLFWEKGGMPAGVLTSKQVLKDTDVTEIRKRWRERYGGYENWIEPAVLDRDATFQRIGLTAEELGFQFIDERDETRICSVLDIPPILVGARVGLDRATYSNYAEARKSWWEDSLKPQYELFDDVIQNDLGQEYGDVKIAWDYSNVPALQEDVDKRWKRYGEATRDGNITINEFRHFVGLEDIEGGDVRLIGAGVTAVGEDAEFYAPEPIDNPEPVTDPDAADDSGLSFNVAKSDYELELERWERSAIKSLLGSKACGFTSDIIPEPIYEALKDRVIAAGSVEDLHAIFQKARILRIDPKLVDELKRANDNLAAITKADDLKDAVKDALVSSGLGK